VALFTCEDDGAVALALIVLIVLAVFWISRSARS